MMVGHRRYQDADPRWTLEIFSELAKRTNERVHRWRQDWSLFNKKRASTLSYLARGHVVTQWDLRSNGSAQGDVTMDSPTPAPVTTSVAVSDVTERHLATKQTCLIQSLPSEPLRFQKLYRLSRTRVAHH